jgi:hypothetical protein
MRRRRIAVEEPDETEYLPVVAELSIADQEGPFHGWGHCRIGKPSLHMVPHRCLTLILRRELAPEAAASLLRRLADALDEHGAELMKMPEGDGGLFSLVE